MGYVFDFNDASWYERWLHSPKHRIRRELETRLMLELLAPRRGETVLDIGCGTGASLLPFVELGLQATGLDASPYMLDIARTRLGHHVDLHRGFAEDLPFDDNTFNYACLVTTLEFVENPHRAIEAACRVAKDRVFIGAVNKFAFEGVALRVKGVFRPLVFNHARFFSPWELKRILRNTLSQVPVTWRTVFQFPIVAGDWMLRLEHSRLVQRCPLGAFVGVTAILQPRFRTRPLALRLQAKSPRRAVPG
jgi:ubiquinone/menaquinone biosynthesis C-methylase UbiE